MAKCFLGIRRGKTSVSVDAVVWNCRAKCVTRLDDSSGSILEPSQLSKEWLQKQRISHEVATRCDIGMWTRPSTWKDSVQFQAWARSARAQDPLLSFFVDPLADPKGSLSILRSLGSRQSNKFAPLCWADLTRRAEYSINFNRRYTAIFGTERRSGIGARWQLLYYIVGTKCGTKSFHILRSNGHSNCHLVQIHLLFPSYLHKAPHPRDISPGCSRQRKVRCQADARSRGTFSLKP